LIFNIESKSHEEDFHAVRFSKELKNNFLSKLSFNIMQYNQTTFERMGLLFRIFGSVQEQGLLVLKGKNINCTGGCCDFMR
jgi:hypothetical protein